MINLIAKSLKKFPNIKLKLKYYYFFFCELIFKKPYLFKTDFQLNEYSLNGNNSFFGYYDKFPENNDGNKIIFHSTKLDTSSLPSNKIAIDIVLYDNSEKKSIIIDQTSSYNWQQGSRLMWLNNYEFIYNVYDADNNSYLARKYNLISKSKFNYSGSIHDCFEDKFALSLSYKRLNSLRPDYGYGCHPTFFNINNCRDDGIFYLDLKEDSFSLLLSLDEIKNTLPKKSMQGCKHWLNHIMISPSGNKFIFTHRWSDKNNQRFDRLILFNMINKKLIILSDNNMVSHCNWENDFSIIGYLNGEVNKPGYYRIDFKNEVSYSYLDFMSNYNDGHMSINNGKMIFDTYPNRSRLKTLNYTDLSSNAIKKIGEFFESTKFFNQTRCDLHPRYSDLSKKVYFDSVHTGTRKLYSTKVKF